LRDEIEEKMIKIDPKQIVIKKNYISHKNKMKLNAER
jgi:hypothetical protein